MENVRERLIIENELKFNIEAPSVFADIYGYLNNHYDVIPYRNALVYDFYFDTSDLALKRAGISYRIRFRPQLSINLKLSQRKKDSIWSRYEYSFKTDSNSTSFEDIFCIDCEIHRLLQKKLGISPRTELKAIGTIQSYRMGFKIQYKAKNALDNSELIGITFFDTSKSLLDSTKKFYEFEMEPYEQAAPHIFDEMQIIGNFLKKQFALKESTKSKIERVMEEQVIS